MAGKTIDMSKLRKAIFFQEINLLNRDFRWIDNSWSTYSVFGCSTQSFSPPKLSIIRKVLIWDTNFEQIDWQKQKTAVIKRIFERGNDQEMNEVIRFYGKETIQTVLSRYNNPFLPAYNVNKQAFLKRTNLIELDFQELIEKEFS